jgi:hypothetical protein
MHRGALGVQNEIEPWCVLVDLSGSILSTRGVLVARPRSAPAIVHSESRKRRRTDVSAARE